MPVKTQAAKPIVYNWPDTLKRAVRNLLDNAIKYGNTASAAIQTTPNRSRSLLTTRVPVYPPRNSHESSTPSIVSGDHEAGTRAGRGSALHRSFDRPGPRRHSHPQQQINGGPSRANLFAEMNRTTMSAAGTSFVCCIIACVQFGP